MAYYGSCHYSKINWLAKESLTYKNLMAALKATDPHRPEAAKAAVSSFFQTLTTAQEAFRDALKPGADLSKLLKDYQDATGIISTRDFAMPDIPNDPNTPIVNSFTTDLIEGIAGAASTEVGIVITAYTLVMDLIALLSIYVHARGIVMNASSADLDNLTFDAGYADANVLPLSTGIPASKNIMNPLDKKNYECVGFTFFGLVSTQDLEGCDLNFSALWKKGTRRQEELEMYCQYYAATKGVHPGRRGDGRGELFEAWLPGVGGLSAVMVDGGYLHTVSLLCCQ